METNHGEPVFSAERLPQCQGPPFRFYTRSGFGGGRYRQEDGKQALFPVTPVRLSPLPYQKARVCGVFECG